MKEPPTTRTPTALEKVNLRQVGSEKKSCLVKKASKQSSRKMKYYVLTSFFSSAALTTMAKRHMTRHI